MGSARVAPDAEGIETTAMDGQTVRTALGTIQINPSAEEAWQNLHDEVLEGGGDLSTEDALTLLHAARDRHAARGESEAVARLLELAARLEPDAEQRVSALIELAQVLAQELFSGSRAISVLERALEISPHHPQAEEQLEELRAKAGRYQAQAKSYLNEAETGSDDEYRSAMLMRAAEMEICFAPEPDFPKTIENLERALRLDNSNLPAARLLEVIYRRQANWEGTVKVLERIADRAADHADRVAAGIRLARLYQHYFDDAEHAAAAYDRVLVSDPTQADAMGYVTEYYSAHERWDELVRAYERPLKSGQAPEETRLGDMLQVAMLHWKKRGQLADAELWFDKIRAVDPTHEGVLAFYRQYKQQLNDDAGLVQILEAARKAIASDDPRAEELDREIESRQSDQTKAQKFIEKYKADLRANPEDAAARAHLKTLYKQTQGHNALVELLRQELERTAESDYAARLTILREIAAVYRQYIKSDTALVAVLNQIVHLDGQLDEHDISEVRELASLYERLGRPRDLLSAQKLLAELVPDKEEKISLYRQVARRWLEQFSNAQHAMEAFASLQVLAPDDPEALERLEDLYRKRRAWKELFGLYEQQLKSLTGVARVPLLREMAQLAAERLSRVDEAIGLYREILQIDSTRTDVLDRLEKIAERAKEWAVLAEVLEQRLAHMDKDESQLPILQKLGAVYGEHLNRQDQANETWQRVVDVQPGNARAMRVLRDNYLKESRFDELELLYTSQNDLEGLAEVLSTAADRNKDPEEKLDLSFRAARVYENQLGQAARAIRSYERILTINPKEPRAIVRLLPLYEEDEKWARIPALLDALIDITQDVDEKVMMLGQLVTIYSTRLMDKKAAYQAARTAYLLAPDADGTYELLESAARAAGEWNDVLTILSERFTALGGVVSASKSEDAAPGLPEQESPTKGKRGRSKQQRRRKGGKQASIAPEAASSPTSEPPPAVEEKEMSPELRSVALRLAKVLGEELGRGAEAIVRLQELAAAVPSDMEVLAEVEKLLRQESRPEHMRWLHDHRQKHEADPRQRALILNEWANYEEIVVGAPAEALTHFKEAAVADPENTLALEAVARLSIALDRPEDAVDAISKHRDLLDGIERAHKDALLAELLAERLKRPTEALEAARRALDGGAESAAVIPVLRHLVEVPEVRADAARILSEQYEAGGDARQEADAVRALVSETTDPIERVELYKKLADIYETKLKEPGAALTVVLEALQTFPAEMDLWDRAGPLAGQAGRPTDLADAFKNALRAGLPDDISLDLSRRAAELHEAILNDPQGSTPYLESVLRLAPDDEFAFTRLKEILTSGERWRELEKLYDSEIERLDSEQRKIEMLSEMAMLTEDIIGDAQRAIGLHRRILTLDSQNAAALDGLDRLFTRLERHEDLLPLLKQRAELAAGEEEHRYLVRFARLALGLHQPEAAIEALERVLGEDPGNYEARDVAEELLEIGGVRVRAAIALESVYEIKDEIRDLVRVLGVRVEALRPKGSERPEDPAREDERRDLLRRIATLRDDRLHDDVGSFDVFAELAPLDPADSELRGRLIDSGRRLGRSERVVEVLLASARAATDTPIIAETLLQAASVQAEALDDLKAAEATYKRVVAMHPDEPDLALSAARAIEAMLEGSDRFADLADNLSAQLEIESDRERKGELIARLAHLQGDVLGQTSAALKTWERRLLDEPEDAEALRNLSELYEKEGRFVDVARVLVQRRDAAIDSKERVNLARHLADVQERQLGQLSDAIASYQAILDETGPSRDVLAALRRLYERTERWEDLAGILREQAELVDDEVERLRALGALGQLAASKLHDLPGALEAYRRALSIDITHQTSREALALFLEHEDRDTKLQAAEILHPIYEADGDHPRLLLVLKAEAEATDDAHYRVERYRAAMAIAEDALHDLPQAFGFAVSGIVEAAAQGEVMQWVDAVERLAAATNARAIQIETYGKIVPDIFDAEEQLGIQRRIAELLRDELGDTQGAIAAYNKALAINADDKASLSALESLYTAKADHTALLEILGKRLDLAESDAERREISFRRAELLANAIKDTDAAIATYEGILDIDLDLRAIEQLERLYTRTERYDDLVALIQRRIDNRPEMVADLRVQMATVLSDKQHETERALDELEQALVDEPQNQAAVRVLERLKDQVNDPALRARVAALLEPVYMVRGDYDSVLNVLLLRLEAADGADERRDLVTRLANIYEEQKEDYFSALEVTALLLKDDLADDLTLSEMERLAKVAGAELRLGELLSDLVAGLPSDDDTTGRLCRRAGEIFAKHDKDAEALLLLRRALLVEPESPELFASVDGLLKKVGTAKERVALHRTALEHRYDPADQQQLLSVIAELQETQLGNLDEAIAAHRQALETDETNQASLNALSRLYTRTQNWQELAGLYLTRADGSAPTDAAQYRILLADLYVNKLSEYHLALEQLEEVVRHDPGSKAALERLEAMRTRDDLKERAVDILRPIYEAEDDWRRLVSLNEDRFVLAQDTMEQVAVLRETADLWERRGVDPVRARRVLVEAVRLQPDDEDVRAELERLVVMTEAWSELTQLYDEVLRDHADLPQKVEILTKLAQLNDEKVDDPRAALNRYIELHELEGSEQQPVDRMLVLSLLLGDWKTRERALLAKVELSYDDAERLELYSRLGELREKTLEDTQGAIEAFESAFELDPRNAEVSDRLIALYQDRKQPERLVDLYLARAEGGFADVDLQFKLLSAAARILETELGEPRRAIECLSRALAVNPEHAPSLLEINRLYRSEEMWPELLDNLRLQAGTATVAGERGAIRHDIAKILADKLQALEEALETYGMILDERPDDEVALDGVFALVEREEHLSRQAADLLIPALRQTSLRERLIAALRLRLRDEHEPLARVETLRTIARVYADELKQPSLALDALLEAMAETPDADDLYQELEALAAMTNAWGRYAQALQQRAAEVFDSELAGRLWVRAGQVFEQRLGKVDEAIAAYQTATEQTGDRLDLLEALDRLHTGKGDTDAIIALLDRRMSLAESDQAQAVLLCKRGRLQLEELDSPADAIASFKQALELDPSNEDASRLLFSLLENDRYFTEVFDILDGVYRDRTASSELAALHRLRVKRASSPQDRIDMRRSLAQVLEDECKDPRGAQTVLIESFLDDPEDEGLRDEVERLLPITEAWTEGAQALLSVLSANKKLSPEASARIAWRAAEWLQNGAKDAEAAEQAFLVAQRYTPDDDEVLEQLEALQSVPGKEAQLLTTLMERARVAHDETTKAEFLRRCYHLANNLGNSEAAEQCLRDLINADEQDQEALRALTTLRIEAKDYTEAYELTNRQIELEMEPERARELRFEVAMMALNHLDRESEAISRLEELLSDDPSDARVIEALQAAYQKSERYEDLSQLISEQLERTTDLEAVAVLKIGLAHLRRERFDDHPGAIALLEEVFGALPDNQQASSALAKLYEETEQFSDLIGLLARQKHRAVERGDAHLQLSLLRSMAKIAEGRLKDAVLAVDCWLEIRTLDDSSETREELLRLMLAAEQLKEAATLLEEICAPLSGAQALRRRRELCELYRIMNDTPALIRTIEGSLAIAPDDEDLKMLLRSEYEHEGEWSKVADLVLKEASTAAGLKEKLSLYREAAEIQWKRCEDPAAAAAILEQAAEAAPTDREVLLLLCDAYSACGRGAEAAGVLEKVVESFGGKRSKELGDIHRRLATAYLSNQQQDKALEELEKAFRIEPGNIHVLTQLGEVALAAGDMKKAQQMFRALLLQRLDEGAPISKAQVFLRLGQIHEKLGEGPKARQMYERAVQTDPNFEEAKRALQTL